MSQGHNRRFMANPVDHLRAVAISTAKVTTAAALAAGQGPGAATVAPPLFDDDEEEEEGGGLAQRISVFRQNLGGPLGNPLGGPLGGVGGAASILANAETVGYQIDVFPGVSSSSTSGRFGISGSEED